MKDGQAGLVIVSVVLILALLGLVTGASLWLTRAELWAAGRARSELQATYTAEAGIRHGLAVLGPDVDWAAVVERDPAALASADEPGPWPIGAGGWVAFPGPPFGYGLEVVGSGDPDGRLVVRSAATAVRGASAVAMASVARAKEPYLPAALVLDGGRLEIEAAAMGTERDPLVQIWGSDVVASLGVSSVEGLETAIDAASRSGVELRGDPIGRVRGFELERYARRSGLDEIAPAVLSVAQGTRGSPVALRIRGGTVPRLLGAGVLLVDGDLDVEGDVRWYGVVYVDGRLRVGRRDCLVDGMVWSRGVSFAGPCRITAGSEAVREADRALRLPRLPVLTALAGEGW